MPTPGIRSALAAALLAALLTLTAACERPLTVLDFSGSTMGTSYDVVVEFRGERDDTASLGPLIEGELAELERIMSTYDSVSELSRFDGYRGTDPVAVDPSLRDVLALALDVAERSSGAFDPTVAPLVAAWGFGPESPASLPDSVHVDSLRALVGYRQLILDTETGTLAKTHRLVRVDLSGIAKGFAAERVAAALEEQGYESALVDVGGELRVLGTHADGRPWRIAVEGPGETAPGVLGTIDLVGEGIATSGDFRNYYEDGGVLYAHIIDPRTGFPIPYRGFSVTVVHPDAAAADAWATALTVLGPEGGFALAEREGLAALFAWRSPAGVSKSVTSGMAGRVILVE